MICDKVSLRVVLVIGLVLGAMPAHAAYVQLRGGSPLGVTPPIFPVNAQQCQEFAERSTEYRNKLAKWHDDCLKGSKAGPNKGQCSAPACEGYHVARDNFSKQSNEEATACYDAVSSQRANLSSSLGGADIMNAAQSALLRGPYGAAMTALRGELAGIFQKRGAAADTKSTAASLAGTMWSPVQAARASCQRKIPASAAIDCEKQVLLSVHEFGSKAIDGAQANPAIAAWQRAMFERLNMQNRDALLRLDAAFEAEDRPDEGGVIGR